MTEPKDKKPIPDDGAAEHPHPLVFPSHSDPSIKNPEGEAENPAPMPPSDQGRATTTDKPVDPEGRQGSTKH